MGRDNGLRQPYWDNAKGVLIALVIFGHLFMSYPRIQDIVTVVYLFHMPAFLFISGYFSKRSSLRWEKMLRLLVPFVFLNVVLLLCTRVVNVHGITIRGGVTVVDLCRVYLSAWYLLALLLYRLTIPILNLRRAGLVLVGLSLLGGMAIQYYGEMDRFILYKIIPLYPFFALGYYFRETGNAQALLKRRNRCAVGLALFAMLLIAATVLAAIGQMSLSNALWEPKANMGSLVAKLMLYPLGLVGTFAVLLVVPSGKIPLLTAMGRNSLMLYVIHRPVTIFTAMLIPASLWGWEAVLILLLVGIAMLRVLTGISIMWFLIPGYVFALALTFFVPQIFTGVAFDSGGVASGPMTATFMLPFAMGACQALGGNFMTDAFGLVAMVAMTPLVTIQLLGLAGRVRKKLENDALRAELARAEDSILYYDA